VVDKIGHGNQYAKPNHTYWTKFLGDLLKGVSSGWRWCLATDDFSEGWWWLEDWRWWWLVGMV